MIHDLKPYPAMKDSGVPWLGQVPEHWEVRSLGSLTRARSERGRTDLPLLSVVREKGVILRDRESSEGNHNFIPDDLSNYKVVREGNLVVNKMKAWQGSMGLAPVAGIVSPAYFVFDFDIQNRLFGQTLLRSKPYVGFFARASDGVRIGQWDLSIDGMKRIPVVIPSPEEQAAIVRFLDHADRRIRRTIAAKQRLIKLLQEQKQVIIHQAVTRGLDPDVTLKPSGVEWLGDVPEGWEVLQLRRLIRFMSSGSRGWAAFYSDSGSVFLQSGNLGRSMELNLSRIQHVSLPVHSEGMRTKIKKGDILICITGALTGNVVEVNIDLDEAYVNQHVALIRLHRSSTIPRFMAYILSSPVGQSQFKTSEYGGTKQGLGLDDVKSVALALPPLDKQKEIVAYLDGNLSELDISIGCCHTEISLLREYRNRLIADVVTGKLDVREAVAGLPDAEPLPTDLELEDGDLEGEDAEAEADAGEVVEA